MNVLRGPQDGQQASRENQGSGRVRQAAWSLAVGLGFCLAGGVLSTGAAEVVRLDAPPVRQWLPLVGPAVALPAADPAAAGPRVETERGRLRIDAGLTGLSVEPVTVGDRTWTRLSAPGWSWLAEPGRPAVLARHFLLPLPSGVTPEVRVVRREEIEVGGLDVEPAQEAPWDDGTEPEFVWTASAYGSAEPYPAESVIAWSVGHLRDQAVLSLAVTPVRVLPALRSAHVAVTLEIEVTWNPTEAEAGSSLGSRDRPALMGSGGHDGGRVPSRYLILLNEQFADNPTLAAFVDWKRRKGYEVRLVRTSEIRDSAPPDAEAVVGYLRTLPASDYPEFLLILGDADPERGVAGRPIQRTPYHAPGFYDFDKACRDDVDLYPDLAYGRLPAQDNRELSLMLAKCLAADRTPPASGLYQRVLVAGILQDSSPRDLRADRLFCETADAVACYFEQGPGGVAYECWRAVMNPYAVPAQCRWNQNSLLWNPTDEIGPRVWDTFLSEEAARRRVSDTLNGGVSLLLHRGHGVEGGWQDPAFRSADIRRLANGEQRPLVLSVNCSTGNYMAEDSMVSAWLRHEDGGAYAVIAAVDVSTSWCNDWMVHGFLTGLLADYGSWHNQSTAPDWPKDLPSPGGAYGPPGSQTRLGPLLNFAKLYMLEHNRYAASLGSNPATFRIFHVFGDPEAEVLLPQLRPLVVAGPTTVVTGVQTVTFTASEPGALVCLFGPEIGVHRVSLADAAGQAHLEIDPSGAGVLAVTATRYGCRPYEGTLLVRNPGDPAPQIERQPESQVVAAGSPIELTVTATGAEPLTYQWFHDRLPLDGGTTARCWIERAQAASEGGYQVAVSNAHGAVTSHVAIVTVIAGATSQFLFRQPEPIVFDDDAPATPYPSTLLVTDVVGRLTNATVTLIGFAHTYPSDVAALLVSPNGQRVVLLSQAGAGAATNVTLQFAAAAPSQIPHDQPLSSGTYRPSDWADLTENGGFPAPAPDGVSTTDLGELNGFDPNGVWALYLWDRERGDIGHFEGGWELELGVNPLDRAAPELAVEPQGITLFVGERAELETRVSGAAPLTWQWLKDGQALPETGPILPLGPVTAAQAGQYTVAVSNRYGAVVSATAVVDVLEPGPLESALDTPGLSWLSYGDAAWAGQTRDFLNTGSAARSGRVGNHGSSTLQTLVAGPGLLSFWWRASSEEGFDFLSFAISGQRLAAISGRTEWERRTFSVPGGLQLLEWTYAKDYSFRDGDDAGWVDDVTFLPTAGRPDHFEWEFAGGDNVAGLPFPATLAALDAAGETVSEPRIPVDIQAVVYGSARTILGDRAPEETGGQGEWGYTDAYDLVPDADVLVTAVRTCYGSRANLWLEDGTLLSSLTVATPSSGSWATTPLPAPLALRAGTRYRLGIVYPSGGTSYYLSRFPNGLSCGVTGPAWFAVGDAYPTRELPDWCPLVDLEYTPLVPAPVTVSPAQAELVDGSWIGNLTLLQSIDQVRLRADDGDGHTGLSEPFEVLSAPVPRAPTITTPPEDQTVTVGSPVSFRVWATGSTPLTYAWLRNGFPIPGASGRQLELPAVQFADAGARFVCRVSNAYGAADSLGAVLDVAPRPIPFREALGDSELGWSTRGDAPWFPQTQVAFDEAAAQSGAVAHGQESVLQTIVSGPGRLEFSWRVSSEPDYDTLSFWIDSVRQTRLSGEVEWTRPSFTIPAGRHALRWVYSKDVSDSFGLDAGWVDAFSFISAVPRLALEITASESTLQVEGMPGTAWILLTSPRLGGPWSSVQTLTLTNWITRLRLEHDGAEETRFYRLITP